MKKEYYKFNPDDAKRFAREHAHKIKKSGDEMQFDLCPYCHGGNNEKDKEKTYIFYYDSGTANKIIVDIDPYGNTEPKKDYKAKKLNELESINVEIIV